MAVAHSQTHGVLKPNQTMIAFCKCPTSQVEAGPPETQAPPWAPCACSPQAENSATKRKMRQMCCPCKVCSHPPQFTQGSALAIAHMLLHCCIAVDCYNSTGQSQSLSCNILQKRATAYGFGSQVSTHCDFLRLLYFHETHQAVYAFGHGAGPCT